MASWNGAPQSLRHLVSLSTNSLTVPTRLATEFSTEDAVARFPGGDGPMMTPATSRLSVSLLHGELAAIAPRAFEKNSGVRRWRRAKTVKLIDGSRGAADGDAI